MRRSLALATATATAMLLSVTAPALATIGDVAAVPGQLVDNGPLAPRPLCQTEAGIAGAASGSSRELKVGTYNVLHTQDADANATAAQRVGMLATAIEHSGADAMGLQEVAKSATLAGLDTDSDGVNGLVVELIAQKLAASTGTSWNWCWFASNPHVPLEPEPKAGGGGGPLTETAAFASGQQSGNGNEFREGVALLSRYPIVSPTVKRLSLRMHEAAFCEDIDPIGCQFAVVFDSRVIMHGVIQAPSGPVDLYTTHLAHGVTSQSDDTKARQIREGLEYIAATENTATPTYYVGDFNTDALAGGSDTVHYASILDAGFTHTYLAAGAHDSTDPAGTSDQSVLAEHLTVDHTIDYVFSKRLGGCNVAFGDIIGDVRADRSDEPGWVWPSDHMGTVSTMSCAAP